MAELDARRTEILANAARLLQRQIRTHLTRKVFIAQRRAAIDMQKYWRGYFFFFFFSYNSISHMLESAKNKILKNESKNLERIRRLKTVFAKFI